MSKIIALFQGLSQIVTDPELNSGISYFPEIGMRKGKWTIVFDQIRHFLKYHSLNKFYFLYGFDRKGFRNESEYIDYETFRKRRELLNRYDKNSPITILRDKFLFGIIANAIGLKTPHNIGLTRGQNLYLIEEKREIDLFDFLHTNDIDVFFKLINGECADGVFHLTTNSGDIKLNDKVVGDEEIYQKIKGNSFILQELISQCDQLNNLHSESINTIRLETIYNREESENRNFPSSFKNWN